MSCYFFHKNQPHLGQFKRQTKSCSLYANPLFFAVFENMMKVATILWK